jgi:hypothetical protein
MKKDTKSECNAVARLARHAIAKTTLDISELNISCGQGGQVELTGKIKLPRGHVGDINVKKEFEVLVNAIRSSRGVRDVYATRVVLP